MDVRPWLVLPKPSPSFHPIFCSILLPILLLSSFLGFWSLCENSACSMAARYFSFNLLGLGPSSSVPYFCRRSLARSRYRLEPKTFRLLAADCCCCCCCCSAFQDSKLLRWRSDFSLCLQKGKKSVPISIDSHTFYCPLYLRWQGLWRPWRGAVKLKNGGYERGHRMSRFFHIFVTRIPNFPTLLFSLNSNAILWLFWYVLVLD